MSDWNDLKYLLQVSREGSTLAASRVLKTSQSTVMRRIAVLEEELGFELFEKRRTGYVPTEALNALMPGLEAIEQAHALFDREASAMARGLSGTVRLTSSELLVTHMLGPALFELRKHYPGIHIELMTTDGFLDLTSGEADIALRAGDPPAEPTLFGRRIAGDLWCMCCSQAYAETIGAPKSPEELKDHALITVMQGMYPGKIVDWIETHVPKGRMAMRHNSLHSIFMAIKSGLGVSAAPELLVAFDADLVRCFRLEIETSKEVWLLAPERHRRTPHVRAVLDFLGNHLFAVTQARLKAAGLQP
jgi:DNA-binding transcriptional LysR family regulator